MAKLLTRYDRASEEYREAQVQTSTARAALAEAQSRVDTATANEAAAKHKLDELRSALEDLEAAAVGTPTLPRSKRGQPPEAPSGGLKRSVKETIEIFPRDGGNLGMEDLRKHFELSDGAINTRVAHAKRGGYLESAGWGRYKLTEKGFRALSGLRVVAANS